MGFVVSNSPRYFTLPLTFVIHVNGLDLLIRLDAEKIERTKHESVFDNGFCFVFLPSEFKIVDYYNQSDLSLHRLDFFFFQ